MKSIRYLIALVVTICLGLTARAETVAAQKSPAPQNNSVGQAIAAAPAMIAEVAIPGFKATGLKAVDGAAEIELFKFTGYGNVTNDDLTKLGFRDATTAETKNWIAKYGTKSDKLIEHGDRLLVRTASLSAQNQIQRTGQTRDMSAPMPNTPAAKDPNGS